MSVLPTTKEAIEVYQSLELKCVESFIASHSQAADSANEEDDVAKIKFKTVIKHAIQVLLDFDDTVKDLNRSYRKRFHITFDIMWGACVAQICTNQILQVIGGPDGRGLGSLTNEQLLDLIAFVESFRSFMEGKFPFLTIVKAKKTHFDEKPDFMYEGGDEEKKTSIQESTKDILTWATNMLWEVHRLSQDEFLLRTRSQVDRFLTKVYGVHQDSFYQINNKQIITSLCENVFSFVNLHLRTVRERLSNESDVLIMDASLIFLQLRQKQIRFRNNFLTSFESCCAAANDFQRMSEQCESIVLDLQSICSDETKTTMLQDNCDALVSLYSGDAVFAAQKTQYYVFEPIWTNIANDYFGFKWEVDYTYNELSVKVVRTLDDFVSDLDTFLDQFLLRKALTALIRASVLFLLQIILRKADNTETHSSKHFGNNVVALERLQKDVVVIREYFEGFAGKMPILQNVIETEFHLLITVQEIMRIAAELSDADPHHFIIVLNKIVKDVDMTRCIVGDLWHIVKPSNERMAWKLTKSLRHTLMDVCTNEEVVNSGQERLIHPELHIGNILLKHYRESRRKRLINVIYPANLRCDWSSLQHARCDRTVQDAYLCRKL